MGLGYTKKARKKMVLARTCKYAWPSLNNYITTNPNSDPKQRTNCALNQQIWRYWEAKPHIHTKKKPNTVEILTIRGILKLHSVSPKNKNPHQVTIDHQWRRRGNGAHRRVGFGSLRKSGRPRMLRNALMESPPQKLKGRSPAKEKPPSKKAKFTKG